jgi:hypothetical protein
MSDYQQTFGPVVIEWDDEPNKLVAKCQSGRFDCKGQRRQRMRLEQRR